MKKIKSFIALVLSIALIGTSVGYSAVFPDVDKATASYSEAVDVLSALEIIKGYEDGTFKPDADVTRAEFATMVVRALGLGGIGSADIARLPFTDLAGSEWAVSDINTAYDRKIINGMSATTFEPASFVTYEQAVKMVVCALGYEFQARSIAGANEPFPNAYLDVATKLDLIVKLDSGLGQNMKRWQNAQLLYNAFNVDLMVPVINTTGVERYTTNPGKTLLTENLKMFELRGTVRADNITSLAENGRTVKAGELLLYDTKSGNEVTYYLGNVKTYPKVGSSVKFYYKRNAEDERTLTYISDVTKADAKITLYSNDIEKATGTYADGFELEYRKNKEDSRMTKVKIVKTPTVLIDDTKVSSSLINKDIFTAMDSTITLIDEDSNGDYDKVIITNEKTFVIKSVNPTDKLIVDQYRTNKPDDPNTIKLDEDDVLTNITIKRTDGTALKFANLAPWNVLTIRKSEVNARTNYDIVVSNKMITGTVTETNVDEDFIMINSKKYELSRYFEDYYLNVAGNSLAVDDEGKFYLDKNDRVCAYDKSASKGSTYGYISGVDFKKNDDYLVLGMIGVDSYMRTDIKSAKKIKIDGISYTAERAKDIIRSSAKTPGINIDEPDFGAQTALACQLVKYGRNSSGYVDTIDTVVTTKEELDKNAEDCLKPLPLTYRTNADGEKVMMYKNNTFTNGNTSFKVGPATTVFLVPKKGDRLKYDEYSKKTYSHFIDSKEYSVEAFDVTGSTGIAKAVVVYSVNTDAEANETSPIAIITKVAEEMNGSDVLDRLTGYLHGNNTNTSTQVWGESSNTLDGFDEGDVITYGKTTKGYIKDGKITNEYKVTGPMPAAKDFILPNSTEKDPDKALYRTVSGLVYGVDAADDDHKSLKVAVTNDYNAIEVTNADGTVLSKADTVDFPIESDTVFYEYDPTQKKGSRVIKKATGKEYTLAQLPNYYDSKGTGKQSAAEVFMFVSKGKLKVVYVIKR